MLWLHLTLALAVHAFAAAIDARLRIPALPCQPYRIDPNRARVAELALLPSVGPSRAEAIVLARVREGPFRDAAELARVPGLGPTIVARIQRWLELPVAASPSPR